SLAPSLSPKAPSLPRPRMAVILQELADAAVSGVAFSADPLTGARDTVVLSAVYGLGEGLVSGELDADAYWVSFPAAACSEGASPAADQPGAALDSRPSTLNPQPVRRKVARKERAVRWDPADGTRLEAVPEALWAEPALTEEQVREIAALARQLE